MPAAESRGQFNETSPQGQLIVRQGRPEAVRTSCSKSRRRQARLLSAAEIWVMIELVSLKWLILGHLSCPLCAAAYLTKMAKWLVWDKTEVDTEKWNCLATNEGHQCPTAQPQDCINPTINLLPNCEYHVYLAQHFSQQDTKLGIDGKKRVFQKARPDTRRDWLQIPLLAGIFRDVFIKNTM